MINGDQENNLIVCGKMGSKILSLRITICNYSASLVMQKEMQGRNTSIAPSHSWLLIIQYRAKLLTQLRMVNLIKISLTVTKEQVSLYIELKKKQYKFFFFFKIVS